MKFPCGRTLALTLSIVLLTAGFLPPGAEAKSLFTVRRTFTVLFLGGSGYLGFRAWDYRRDANRLYKEYKQATTTDQATTLFRRTSDRDTKSQISLVLSGALLVAGLRMVFWGGGDKGEEPAKSERGFSLDVKGHPGQKALGMALKKRF